MGMLLSSYEKNKNHKIWGPIHYAYPIMPFGEFMSTTFAKKKKKEKKWGLHFAFLHFQGQI